MLKANEERSQGGREVKRSEAWGGGSCATGDTINVEILKRNRKIERLERELRERKNTQEGYDQQQSRRQRSMSHSGSCESSHRFLKRSEKDHRAQRSSRWSRSGEKTRKTSPMHKPEKKRTTIRFGSSYNRFHIPRSLQRLSEQNFPLSLFLQT